MKYKSFNVLITVAFVCFIGMLSCSEKGDKKNQLTNKNPVPNNGNVREDPTPWNIDIVSVPVIDSNEFTFTDEEKKKSSDALVKEVKDDIRKQSKAIGLSDLQKSRFQENEKEFRLWLVDSPKSLTGFVAFQKSGKNYAFKVMSDHIAKKIERIPVTGQELNWDNWWFYLDSQNSYFKQKHGLPKLDIDMEYYVIEIASNNEYIFAMFSPGDINAEDATLFNFCEELAVNFGIKLYCSKY